MADRINMGSDVQPPKLSTSLRDKNNSISTRTTATNDQFFKGYKASNSPTPESDTRKNYRTYPYDYFSGIDAKVFFGDIWVDDIVTVQYSVNQSKVPVYGYASQLYDAVARGTVIVQGSLTVAFKEMGYLNMVQRIMETQRDGARSAIEKKVSEYRDLASKQRLQFIPALEGSAGKDENSAGLDGVEFSPNGTAQIIRKGETIETILRSKKGGNVVSSGLGAALFEEENPNGNRDFEDFAEVMEDTIWGDSNGHVLGRRLQYRRPDEFDYFYADGKDAGGVRVARKDYADVLNIMITFGDMNDFRAEHTVLVLNDVHFTSTNIIIAPTGEPIGETYTFFARDINQNISSSTFNIPPIKFEVGQDINISKLKDIQEVEKALNYQQGFGILDIRSIAKFNDNFGWVTASSNVITKDFNKNEFEPFVDQLIRAVELGINNNVYSEIDTDFSQHILDVTLTQEDGGTANLKFVVQQDITGTHTYKVISPTRNNFSAVNIFSREDMWGDITADQLQKIQDKKEAISRAKQEELAKKTEKARIDAENTKKAADAALKSKEELAAAEAKQYLASTDQVDWNWGEYTPEQMEQIFSVKNAAANEGIAVQGKYIGMTPYSEKDVQRIAARGKNYEQQIIQEAQKQGVNPADTLAVVAYESGFKPTANSSAGAQGLFQVLPKYYGPVSANPEQQIPQGVAAYKEALTTAQKLNTKYNTGLTDQQLAVAVYNAGGTAIENRLKTGADFPEETKASIAKSEQFRQYYSEQNSSTKQSTDVRYDKAYKISPNGEVLEGSISVQKKTNALQDTTIALSPELKNLYPNAPDKVHIKFVDAIPTTNAEGSRTYARGAADPNPGVIKKITNTGEITLARTNDPEAMGYVLAHELEHLDQFGRGPQKEVNKKYFDGEYSNQLGEKEARIAAQYNGDEVSKELNGLLMRGVEGYNRQKDPLGATYGYFQDADGNYYVVRDNSK